MKYFFLLFFLALVEPVWAKFVKIWNPFLSEQLEKFPEAPIKIFVPYRPTRSVLKDIHINRLVHILKKVFIGVDGRYSLPNSQTPFNYGPVVGVQLSTKIATRIWAGVNLPDIMQTENNGFRIGSGVKLDGRLTLNLEYQQRKIEDGNQQNNYSTILSLNYSLH